MLDDYEISQPIIYKILKNAIKNNQYSHAYLFETNGYTDSFNLLMAFTKSLLCPNKYLKKENCNNCHQCEVIEAGNFPEIKIINPDGLWIKKEQLRELQAEFNEKALIGNKRIYIINHAEKMNMAAANSILKFLEEPEGEIIALLVTDNIYSVIETIRSRCQILRLKDTKENTKESEIVQLKNIIAANHENKEEIINNQEVDNKIIKVIEFINYYEKHHFDTIIYMNKLWNDYIKNKEDMIDSFDIIILYYKDIINIKLNKDLEIFNKTKEIESIANNNDIKTLCKKLNIILKHKQNIKYNANNNLLMDKLIIDLEGEI